jgi:hypothetical protein
MRFSSPLCPGQERQPLAPRRLGPLARVAPRLEARADEAETEDGDGKRKAGKERRPPLAGHDALEA